MQGDLPSFDRPPVVETVLGIQFPRIKGMTNAHLGAFWKSLGIAWPEVEDAPPLEPEIETFGGEPGWSRGTILRLSSTPPSGRLWIRNKSRDRLIQVQNGRLHYNWVAQAGGDYPRYHRVRPEFDGALTSFQDFVRRELDADVLATQWEVTYVNRIPKGTVWDAPEDWVRLFADRSIPVSATPLTSLESFGGEWHYEIPPQRGRLHVEIQHRSQKKGPDVLIVKLTARGGVASLGDGGMTPKGGLDLGREVIVRAFHAMTSADAHRYWGIRS